MHQLIGKKNKIIIYLLFLFILSTTSAKFKGIKFIKLIEWILQDASINR